MVCKILSHGKLEMSVNVAANTAPATKAANTGILGGLFTTKKPEASTNTNMAARNQRNLNAKEKERSNAKKAKEGPGLMSSLFGAAAPAAAPAAAAPAAAAAAPNTAAAAAPNTAAAARNRTRKSSLRRQRGGARRGYTMRLPTGRNVLRVTGKTARKLGRVGVYGLKKVGNGVHVVTGLLGRVLQKGTRMVRKMTKRRQH